MRAVNLLPEEYRPRVPAVSSNGGAYVVLGVLGALLVGVLLYVLTLNQIGSREDAIAEAKKQTAAAEQQTKALKPVADFLQVKEQREQSVKQLANQRFDWERLVLELSRVMPRGVYLLNTSTSLTGSAEGGTGTTGTPAGAQGAGAGTQPPKMTMLGCAPSQDALATTLVRLRRLHGAEDVTLSKSADEAGKSASGSSSSTPSSSAPAASGATQRECRPNEYEFEAAVTFKPVVADAGTAKPDGKVPASLGGGR